MIRRLAAAGLLCLALFAMSAGAFASTPQWAWMKGKTLHNNSGVYGTQGQPGAGNRPGGRLDSVSWVDGAGKFWIFGGNGHDATNSAGYLNDLWRYDPATDIWTWFKGSRTIDPKGVYGTQGASAVANTPGGRAGAVAWVDSAGRLCLFGGEGRDASGNKGFLNDLWRYDPATGNWTWLKGNKSINKVGVYGTPGTADAANTPGGRTASVVWTDGNGQVWLFGGEGYGATSSTGYLNDLWRYDPVLGNWTWVKGSKAVNQAGSYGAPGMATNTPGGRRGLMSWLDSSGRLCLFGGLGRDASGNAGYLNDLWRFDPATGNWTWLKGASTTYSKGIYGTQGNEAGANTPGARRAAVSWLDANGRLCLFGGLGRDASGNEGMLNDLWRFDPATGNWTWLKGASTMESNGVYGTRGAEDPANAPGARGSAVARVDGAGRVWFFGGTGRDALGVTANLNDLWRFDLTTGNWTWIAGSSSIFITGVYGTKGVEAPDNTPGARENCASWIDKNGQLWLLGGGGPFETDNIIHFGDLWRYNPATGNWAWIKGSSLVNQNGVYGTQGAEAAANTPGARRALVTWTDSSGYFWLFGGGGCGASGGLGSLNDIWRYNPATGYWAWIKGSKSTGQKGTYGTQGTAAAANTPGARWGGAGWLDGAGRFWTFGGKGNDSAGNNGYLCDLWCYDPAANLGTWIKGPTTINQAGIYGAPGMMAAANNPGARTDAVAWIDRGGRLWLFGGYGRDATGAEGSLNDLWRFDPVNVTWTWIKGANKINQNGVYGTPGAAAPANTPGTRMGATAWSDDLGRFWLFGGRGYGATGGNGALNDLWRFDPATGNWTWIGGSSLIDQPGVYGVQGTVAEANTPGARWNASAWVDDAGRVWLFGGVSRDALGAIGHMNDLWMLNMGRNAVDHKAWSRLE